MVRSSERLGGWRITVFTSPNPFRAGPVDISVLVQDAVSGEPVPEVDVTVRAWPTDHPEDAIRCPATVQAATNKLFHAAQFDLREAGRWQVEVKVESKRETARSRCVVEAGPPLPRWLDLLGWMVWPLVPIGLFVVHQVITHRGRTRCRSRLAGRL